MSYLPRILEKDLTINVPSDFATVQEALESISNYIIASDKTVTINVEAGGYTQTSPEKWHHKCACRIRIEGVVDTVTIASVTSSGGSAGNWVMNYFYSGIPTESLENLYGILRPTTLGLTTSWHCGVWKITDIDTGAGTITLANNNGNSAIPAAAFSGSLRVLKSQITGTVNIMSSFLAVKNICFYSATTCPCIVGEASITDYNTGSVSIDTETTREDISVFMKYCGFVSGNSTALLVDFSKCMMIGCSANTSYGVSRPALAFNNSSGYMNGCSATSGSNSGFQVDVSRVVAIGSIFDGSSFGIYSSTDASNSTLYMDGVYVCYNATQGIRASSFHCSGESCNISQNTGAGIYGEDMAYFDFFSTTIQNNNGAGVDTYMTANSYIVSTSTTGVGSSYSPAHNVVGNNNSYTYVTT